jgi:hypothetical protein
MVFFTRGSRAGILYISLIMLINASCVNTRNAVYFNSIGKASFNSPSGNPEPVIQKNDLLSITVSSLNPEANRTFNSLKSQSISGTGASLVHQQGDIACAIIEKELLFDPLIDMRFFSEGLPLRP